MSQAGQYITGPFPANPIETITGDTGGALGPTGGNFNIKGGQIAGTTWLRVDGTAPSTETINAQYDKFSGTRNLFMGGIAAGPTAGNITLTGTDNIGLGDRTLNAVTTGFDLIAIGSLALNSATNATSSIAIGRLALNASVGGQNNVAIGEQALTFSTSNNNVAIGVGSLDTLVGGQGNIAIGLNSGGNLNAAQNGNIIIGTSQLGLAADNNVIRLGKWSAAVPLITDQNITYLVGTQDQQGVASASGYTQSHLITTQATVQTVNNTATTIWSFTLGNGTSAAQCGTLVVAALINGMRNDGFVAVDGICNFTAYTLSGAGSSVIPAVSGTNYVNPATAGVTFTANVAGGTYVARIQVTGEAAQTYNWIATVRYNYMTATAA